MATTVQRIHFCVTKETQRQLNQLCNERGENRAQIIKQAIDFFYQLRQPLREVTNETTPTI